MTLAEDIYTQNGRVIEVNPPKKAFNLGGGGQRYKGVTNIDILKGEMTDIVQDLNVFPWPIPDNTADMIFSFHSLEHLDDLLSVMKEAHRISKNGAHIVIEVPYFRHSGAFQDPTHKHFFTSKTMDYFCSDMAKGRPGGVYSSERFDKVGFWYGWPAQSRNLFARVFKKFIQRYPKFYDEFLSKLVPVKIVVFELEVVK